jgi:hypothetical protein
MQAIKEKEEKEKEEEEEEAQDRSLEVKRGLEFLLRHFSSKPPLFPRNIARGTTKRSQFDVDSIDKAMLHYRASHWEDLRVSAFRIGQTNPDLIFIDVDDVDDGHTLVVVDVLPQILRNIDRRIGGHPTVIRSGRGYHIIQPINCPKPLEEIKELAVLEAETSKVFLQFAPRYLSSNKSDLSHHPSLESCLLRVPGSINSKNGAEVRVIQEWDGYRPHYGQLFDCFRDYLLDKQQQRRSRRLKNNNNNDDDERKRTASSSQLSSSIEWIDKLLQTAASDNRKRLIFWVLAPYLINIRGLDYNKAFDILESWVDVCASVRRLEPSRSDFRFRIKDSLQAAIRDKRMPTRFETFKEYYPEVFKQIWWWWTPQEYATTGGGRCSGEGI